MSKEIEIPEGYEAKIEGNKVILEPKESEDERIRKEIRTLYNDIDSCIDELLKARTNKDAEAEGKALFRTEGLMVGTLQDLSCIDDWLEKQKELSELGKYIAAKRSKVGFYCNHKEVSWNEIPLEERKHDYPYYFDGDIDCYPFVVRKQEPAE